MTSDTALPNAEWKPRHSPWLISIAVMLATFMEVLDTSVANVSLPHIAGNLSATTHEATWVLTSYLVANAIILPATAWFGGFFGRKRFLILCVMLFTMSSALCGLATNLGMLITARIFQGLGGGALQPISQAVLIESFPREKRGVAMAVFALGVIVAPIIGPTVGGWITDNFSWRWIFLINLPIGILAVILSQLLIEDPPYIRKNKAKTIDFLGFSMMAVGLGTLQLVLDKGQEVDWFSAVWVRWSVILIVVSLTAFVIREVRIKNPVVNFRILKDVNFTTGTIIVTILGAVLYGTTALLPLYLQGLMGYTAYLSGLALSPRGIAAFLTTIVIGRIIGHIDMRYLVAFGLFLLGITCYQLGNINFDVEFWHIIMPVIGTGIGISSIFIPLTTLTMGTLKQEDIGNAAGLFNLMRNIGGSVGIATVTTVLARMSQVHQSNLVNHLDIFNPVYQQKIASLLHIFSPLGPFMAQSLAHGFIYRELLRQSALMAYVDNFRGFGILSLLCVVTAFFFRKVDLKKGAPPLAH
ncbi:DHA2 family efflux MFS transporter permease subunit [Omnitrophica bacterium]|nr:DHA2 family efflux MFS transporter permease subunit [Candidatus Omnitrophota bacterium]